MSFKNGSLALTLTPAAQARVQEMLEDESEKSFLRIWIQGGGCSGMKYGFDLETVETSRDIVYEQDGVRVLVDAISAAYLQNSELDYFEDFQGSKFLIQNPNASATCGCGESFSY